MSAPLRQLTATLLRVLGCCLWLLPGSVWANNELAAETDSAAGFEVLFSEIEVVDGVVRLDAGFDLRLSAELIEAINRGVPMTLNIEMAVWRERSYWFDDEVANVVQAYTITYSELTRSYLLDNINSGAHFQLPSLEAALWVVAALSDFPFIDASLLTPGGRYYYRIRVGVDVASLPVPLRVMAFISSRWHLTSDWYRWPLAH